MENDKIINDCNSIDRQDICEYCGGKVKYFRGGYKNDEVAKECQDCGMIDPR